MESNPSRILHELQSLRAAKTDLDRKISALEAHLHQTTLQNDAVPNGSYPPIWTVDISRLKDHHDPNLTPEMIHRYSRHLLLPSFGVQAQSNLLKSSVLVVGAGGLGSPALLYLAACGVGRLGIVDHDVVELNNMQRQIIHTEVCIGQPKVKSAAAACRPVNSTVQIVEHHEALRTYNALEIFTSCIWCCSAIGRAAHSLQLQWWSMLLMPISNSTSYNSMSKVCRQWCPRSSSWYHWLSSSS